MYEIREVKTKKEQKLFVDFPTKLYEGNKQYVHPLRSDELGLFNRKKNVSYDDCDAIYFLAFDGDKVVGRIAGIIQRLYNDKVKENRVRFTRFDCIDNEEVAKLLFDAVEKWGKSKGMNIFHGPLGFNDLDREGLLIDGFEYLSTFEEQYNYPYYAKLIEACGFVKETDWIEYRIMPPKEIDPRITRLTDLVLKRYNLHIAPKCNKRKYINKYKSDIFEVLNEAYCSLHGVVPFNDRLREQIISQFNLIISLDFVVAILDKDDHVVAFGFAMPSISKAVQKSKGRLTPLGIARIFHSVKHPEYADFGLIAVKQEYQGKGLTAIMLKQIVDVIKKYNLEYCETNLNLEDNLKIQQTWKNFEHKQHKRRRCYVKNI